MEDRELYLSSCTFNCPLLDANITIEQCEDNCAVASKQYKDYLRGWTDLGEYFEQTIKDVWDWQEDKKTVLCIMCSHFKEPTQLRSLQLRKSKRVKRYPDTEAGKLERSLLNYMLNCQEKLYEEEKHYLSGTPSVSADVSKFYYSPEEMDTPFH